MTLLRPVLGKIFRTNIGNIMKGAHIGNIHRDLHDILHVCFVGDKNSPDVLKNLHRLGSEITLPDHIAGFIQGDLPGDKQQRATRYAHRVRMIPA